MPGPNRDEPYLTLRSSQGRVGERYAVHGVAHYWILNPMAETIECYRLVEGHYVLDALGTGDEKLDVPAFPGLTIELNLLWARFEPLKA